MPEHNAVNKKKTEYVGTTRYKMLSLTQPHKRLRDFQTIIYCNHHLTLNEAKKNIPFFIVDLQGIGSDQAFIRLRDVKKCGLLKSRNLS